MKKHKINMQDIEDALEMYQKNISKLSKEADSQDNPKVMKTKEKHSNGVWVFFFLPEDNIEGAKKHVIDELMKVSDSYQSARIRYSLWVDKRHHMVNISPRKLMFEQQVIDWKFSMMLDFAINFPDETIGFTSDQFLFDRGVPIMEITPMG